MHRPSPENGPVALWVIIGLLIGAGLIEALNLGGAADRTAAANRAKGGSGWDRGRGIYRIRPTTTRSARLVGAACVALGAALLLVQLA